MVFRKKWIAYLSLRIKFSIKYVKWVFGSMHYVVFEKEIKLGLPHSWDGNGEVLGKEEFKERITRNRNETPFTR